MPRRNRRTGISFLFALIINAIVLFVLLGGVAGIYYTHKTPQPTASATEEKKPIVHAVAYNQSEVDEQIQRIKAERKAKREAEIRWKQHLETQAKAAEAARKKALEEEKAVHAKTLAQKQKAEANLARLAHLQKKMQQQLTKLTQERQQLQNQNSAVNERLQQTQKALKQSLSQAEKARLEAKLMAEKAHQRALEQEKFNNEIARFKALIQNDIERQWLLPDNVSKDQSTKLAITLDPYGNVKSVHIISSSGDALLDRSAVTAVLKASPLPVPQSPILLKQFRTISITLKPEGVVSDAS